MPDDNDHDELTILKTRFEEYRLSMSDRLVKLNELREQVTADREAYLRNDVYQARHEDLRKRIEAVNEASGIRHDTLANELRTRIEALSKEMFQRIDANYASLNERLAPVINTQSRLIGIGVALMALAALLGSLLGHFWK